MTDKPDACEKGHPIWWFSQTLYGSWGICSNEHLAGCQHVWFFPKKEEEPSLHRLDEFSARALIRYVREYAKITGRFDT